ncbi:NAD(P)/FAD-dependent oxidoreductase [Nocardioides sp.]|uniref:NAD(P)/FAD-dependent oxidoreductase n=1 Tax=Nocardioides sp. TaxID=35761 RepID=UPI0035296F4F
MTSVEGVDVVVVGGGTVGGWAACFLREAGLSVLLLEAGTLGRGASSRAAGMVRAQGGTEPAVRLGMWSQEFYRGQAERYGVDSGFVATGYYMPCFAEAEVAAAHERIAMQNALGLAARWVEPEDVDAGNPAMAPGRTLGASYFPGDGWIDPPRNVLAYATVLATSGVQVRERTSFTGLLTEGGRVTGVQTSRGEVGCTAVVLTGGPGLAAVGAAAGARRIWSGGTRHQVVVTAAHPDLAPERLPMVFDVTSGIYWRPEDGGLLWGMSNPDEPPGEAADFDQGYFALMRARMAELVPVTAHLGLRRQWAATIDYTPDHLPILGPMLAADGSPVAGAWVAAAGGHGMMWGPGVSRAAADLALAGTTSVVDVTDLGMDRFDDSGRSRLAADPIALPFPQQA